MIDPVKGYKPKRPLKERLISRDQIVQLAIWLGIAVAAVIFLAVIWMW